MKNIKKMVKVSILTSGALVPFFSVVSCSKNDESMESKLANLLSENDLFNIKLNIEKIKEVSGKEKITLGDLFLTNTQIIIIEPSKKMQQWNDSLSENEKGSFTIDPKVSGVELPQINSSGELESLNVFFDIRTGSSNDTKLRRVKKTLPLKNINGFNNKLSQNINNSFAMINSDEIKENKLWFNFTENIKWYIRNMNIDFSNSNNELNNKLNFKFEDSYSSSSNRDEYMQLQNNLYCSYNNKENNVLSITIYTNDKKIDEQNKEQITKDCVAFKILIPVYAIETGSKG